MPTSTRKKRPFYGGFPANPCWFSFRAVGADDPVRPQETPVFTEIRCEIATFSMGRCRHRPLQTATKIQRILKGGQSRPPLQMTVKNRTGHAKTAAFPILRRRGRCLHRPARNGRFMAVFRRNRVDFLFYAVGADDPVRPPETPFSRKTDAKSQHFQWADVGIGPYTRPRKFNEF